MGMSRLQYEDLRARYYTARYYGLDANQDAQWQAILEMAWKTMSVPDRMGVKDYDLVMGERVAGNAFYPTIDSYRIVAGGNAFYPTTDSYRIVAGGAEDRMAVARSIAAILSAALHRSVWVRPGPNGSYEASLDGIVWESTTRKPPTLGLPGRFEVLPV